MRQPDPLLLPFLQASDEAESQPHLERLIVEHAEPIVKGIVARRCRVSFRRAGGSRQSSDEQDAEDVCGEAIAQLLQRLRDLKTTPDGEAISDFRGYVAVATYRACDRYLRQKYPQRWSLKNRLRYLLTHQPGLALWESDQGERLCGFATWRDQGKAIARSGRLGQLRDDPQAFAHAALPREDVRRMNPADLLAAIFNWVGSPVELDELVSAAAGLWGVQDQTARPESDEEAPADPHERVPDPSANVAAEVDQRAYLQQLWGEVRQLPPRQCAALLLNLRDAQGHGVIALLPLTGIATVRQIAAALPLPAGQFAALWNDLPLDDATIAQHLEVTRQQVINLRKVARERLARRMRAAGF